MNKSNTGHSVKSLFTKKRLLIAAVVAAVCGIAAFGTMAQLSGRSNDKENNFAPMTITDINIEEPSGTQYELDENNTVTTKQVIIDNPAGNTKKPVFVRVRVVPSVKDEQGKFTNVQVALDGATQFNTDWVYQDGYYYYKKVVMPGETTTELFKNSTVVLDCTLEAGQTVDLAVIADSVQAISNVPGEKEQITTSFAQEAWGYSHFETAKAG